MILDENTAQETAKLLLQINAIKLKPQEPFTWSSGMKSPIYCDNRIILSYPPIRNYIKDSLAKQVELLYGKPDVIAGVATGAIGIGALTADALGLPFVYVRPKPKSHGRQNQIEGQLEPNQNVVVIEDLVSTGQSSLNAVKAIQTEAQAQVKGLLAIFSYGFDSAVKNFEEAQIQLNTLSNYEHLIQKAYDTRYLNRDELNLLKTWHLNPEQWKSN
ncbi:orotate phosphoribosyltransferase [Flavobacteriaceae bacterium 14752]|uniref:orotate phosphoribosyltransferase n=1 Tax=Mesohalobacter salilacus TaxID=2491711 RepID=UPI000F63A1CE|nr:orotate phosphoribosyltransferase [Flavobacteriaceae bacterium 14752]